MSHPSTLHTVTTGSISRQLEGRRDRPRCRRVCPEPRRPLASVSMFRCVHALLSTVISGQLAR